MMKKIILIFTVLLMSSMTFAVNHSEFTLNDPEKLSSCEDMQRLWTQSYYMYTVKPGCFHIAVLVFTNTSLGGDVLLGVYEMNVGDCGSSQFISDVTTISSKEHLADTNVVNDIKAWYDNFTP